MVRARRAVAGLLAIAVLGGCEAEGCLRACGVRSFREVSVAEARRQLARQGTLLLEVRPEAEAFVALVPGAVTVAPEGPLPTESLQAAKRVIVIATDRADAHRIAARVARLDGPAVDVVAGGLDAWRRAGGAASRVAGTGAHEASAAKE